MDTASKASRRVYGHNRVINESQISVFLASPYHFRKQGVYQLRVRPCGATNSCTVSLRTTDRPTAMKTSKLLQSTLRTFHLDNPDATWEELRDRLKVIAETTLATSTEWASLEDQALLYADWQSDLQLFARTGALTAPQARATVLGGQLMGAALRRLRGAPEDLLGMIDEFNDKETPDSLERDPVSLSVGPTSGPTSGSPSVTAPLTFEALAETYREEHRENITPSTFEGLVNNHRVIAAALKGLDLRIHTRADLIALRASLVETRKPSTVNNLIANLSTVLRWAENNDMISKAYIHNLKFQKGALSTREAFSQEQVGQIMKYANGLPMGSWKRWGLSLAVITGARMGEILQLTKEDIGTTEGGIVFIDINDNGGKGLKTKQSKRQVPLTDGAYGFSLKEFLQFVAEGEGSTVLGVSVPYAGKHLNSTLRELVSGDNLDLTFHSLRHSLASLMQAEGVPVAYTQGILGQSSGTLAYDTYGSTVPVDKLAVVLREKLPSVLP